MSKIANVFVVSAKAARLADLVPGAASLGDNVTVLFVGAAAEASDVFGLGASALVTFAAQPDVIFEDYAPSMAAVIKEAGPALILLPADRRGKAMGAKLAAALGAALVNDAALINLDGGVNVEHMVYGGLAVGAEASASPVTVITVGSGVFEAATPASGKSGEVSEGAFIAPAHPFKLLESKPKTASSVDLTKAKRVVGVGRGFAKAEDLGLANDLAAAIEGAVGCSRPIAEGEGWMERERYIGVSGVKLKADVYFTLGISGQIQHMVGAGDSKVIIAVNKDKNAPIFKSADYGIVGDLYKIIPAVTKALKG
jgi:electron transfer flavoprotein alpha subunit